MGENRYGRFILYLVSAELCSACILYLCVTLQLLDIALADGAGIPADLFGHQLHHTKVHIVTGLDQTVGIMGGVGIGLAGGGLGIGL